MFGQNPKRSALFNNGIFLEVKNIFKTIQGEGPFAGMPAIFIRLGGCNLACSFCDTEFEDFDNLHINVILDSIANLNNGINQQKPVKLIVITGGEPFRQPIELLCEKLLSLGYLVQIETNGTLYRSIPQTVHIVCSPKAGKNGYFPIREDLLKHINSFKFLISQNLTNYSTIPELGQNKYNIPVFIQPMDQYDPILNEQNKQLTVQLALNYGYQLSLQTHKILDIE